MAEPFLAEIRLMSFVFPPKGWALCDGQLLPINQNQALFSLLGTTYGGDGRVNFGLPNLQSRTPMHVGNGHTLGERGGETASTLTIQQMPLHLHTLTALSDDGTVTDPTGNILASPLTQLYRPLAGAALTTLRPDAVASVGQSQAHVNMQPYLTLSFCIALQGIFPSQT